MLVGIGRRGKERHSTVAADTRFFFFAEEDSLLAVHYLSSLLMKSPKPGVSTTLSFRRTPFSSISVLRTWMPTVFGLSSERGACSLAGYKGALNKVLTRVDLPSPDSPIDRRAN